MFYKSLILLVFANMFNQAYQLRNIQCPQWVPGTNRILPAGVELSPDLKLKNLARCFCEVVKVEEQRCIAANVPKSLCKDRTNAWIEDNLQIRQQYSEVTTPVQLPHRDRMINVEP